MYVYSWALSCRGGSSLLCQAFVKRLSLCLGVWQSSLRTFTVGNRRIGWWAHHTVFMSSSWILMSWTDCNFKSCMCMWSDMIVVPDTVVSALSAAAQHISQTQWGTICDLLQASQQFEFGFQFHGCRANGAVSAISVEVRWETAWMHGGCYLRGYQSTQHSSHWESPLLGKEIFYYLHTDMWHGVWLSFNRTILAACFAYVGITSCNFTSYSPAAEWVNKKNWMCFGASLNITLCVFMPVAFPLNASHFV